jgi:hypothetical protein
MIRSWKMVAGWLADFERGFRHVHRLRAGILASAAAGALVPLAP